MTGSALCSRQCTIAANEVSWSRDEKWNSNWREVYGNRPSASGMHESSRNVVTVLHSNNLWQCFFSFTNIYIYIYIWRQEYIYTPVYIYIYSCSFAPHKLVVEVLFIYAKFCTFSTATTLGIAYNCVCIIIVINNCCFLNKRQPSGQFKSAHESC